MIKSQQRRWDLTESVFLLLLFFKGEMVRGERGDIEARSRCNWELGTPVGFWVSSHHQHPWIIRWCSANVHAVLCPINTHRRTHAPFKHTHTFLWPCLGSHRGELKWVSNVHIICYWVSSHCTNPLQMLASGVYVCVCCLLCGVCIVRKRHVVLLVKEVGMFVIGEAWRSAYLKWWCISVCVFVCVCQ